VIWLAYYLVVVPILVMAFIPGNRAPRWLFWGTIATAAAGVSLTMHLLIVGAS
jgi:hypothetical protein